uniref:Transposase n=1 Tax=Ascaris lumbricoides TaxID=6252 RepID=A0A0M3I2C2_ASCLU
MEQAAPGKLCAIAKEKTLSYERVQRTLNGAQDSDLTPNREDFSRLQPDTTDENSQPIQNIVLGRTLTSYSVSIRA